MYNLGILISHILWIEIHENYLPYVRHYCPLSNYKPHPPKNKLIFIFYCIFELKFPHKKSKKQIEAADNRAAGTVGRMFLLVCQGHTSE